jgi:hypothetical protein
MGHATHFVAIVRPALLSLTIGLDFIITHLFQHAVRISHVIQKMHCAIFRRVIVS